MPQADLALLDPVQTTGLVTRNHGMLVFDTLYGVDIAQVARPQMAAGHQIEDSPLLTGLEQGYWHPQPAA